MTKISIITINLNNQQGLKRTIESVVSQTSSDYEYIVVDGDSNDGSKEVIVSYGQKINKAIIGKDTGIYHAMNKGIAVASGEYLLFLNSGDHLKNDHVMHQVASFLNGEEVIGGSMIKIVNGKEHLAESPAEITVDWFMEVSLHHQATFIKRDLFLKLGMYREDYRLGGDYEFFVRALLVNNASYKSIDTVISVFYADGISNQPSWMELNMKEKQRTWDIHFSKEVQDNIKAYYDLLGSKEIKWGRRVMNRLPFLKKL